MARPVIQKCHEPHDTRPLGVRRPDDSEKPRGRMTCRSITLLSFTVTYSNTVHCKIFIEFKGITDIYLVCTKTKV